MCQTCTLPQPTSTAAQRAKNNADRARKMAKAKYFNRRYYEQVDNYIQANGCNIPSLSRLHLHNFRKSIGSCAENTLWRGHGNGAMDFIAAHTCKHKYCSVCNMVKAKQIRRKYRAFFDKNPDVLEDYDFLHLTLTVPHADGTFRGKEVYIKEIMQLFNKMRKSTWWNKMVWGGEFGVEMTRNTIYKKVDGVKVMELDEQGNPKTGLHIHIHSLLLAYRNEGKSTRNELHEKILFEWNKLTRDEAPTKQAFDATNLEDCQRLAPIARSNPKFHEKDGHGGYTKLHFDRLTPYLCKSGATMIGLESLYLKSKKQMEGYHWSESHNTFIKRIDHRVDGVNDFMRALTECIKYHFKPSVFTKNGELDMDLLIQVLPEIYKQPLYQKFGAFSGNSKHRHPDYGMLNLNASVEEEVLETFEETAHSQIINPVTLEAAEADDFKYCITSLRNIHFDEATNRPILRSKKKVRWVDCSLMEALTKMLTARFTTGEIRTQDGADFGRMDYEREVIQEIFYYD